MQRARGRPRKNPSPSEASGAVDVPGGAASSKLYYQLFKACRLCGCGGGYKIPIVQHRTASGASRHEPELRQKIHDCCSIDVQPDDKMPPLICELCVDKVNDFFEFREMCLQTNTSVRASLGLPAQNLSQNTTSNREDDCILGVSGPLIYDSSRDIEVKPNIVEKGKRGRPKKEEKFVGKKVKINIEPEIVVKPDIYYDTQPLLSERKSKKRNRSDSPPPLPPIKKLKITNVLSKKNIQVIPVASKKAEKAKAKEAASAKKAPPPPSPTPSAFSCVVCQAGFANKSKLTYHLTTNHMVIVWHDRLSCNPCQDWFVNARAAEEHHKWHKTTATFYHCHRCSADFKVLQSYNKHFAFKQCIPDEVVPDPVCSSCKKTFATENLMKQHACKGYSKNECSQCKKAFEKKIQLKKHEKTCTSGFPSVNPNNPHLKILKPVHVTVPKCDDLLRQIKREPIDITDSDPIYDVSCLNTIIKTEPIEESYYNYNDVNIKQEIKEECFDQYNDDPMDRSSGAEHSDDEASQASPRVESLSFLTLKAIFKNQVKQKRMRNRMRNIKVESQNSAESDPFDSLLGKEPTESSVSNLVITSVEGGATHFQMDNPEAEPSAPESSSSNLNENDVSDLAEAQNRALDIDVRLPGLENTNDDNKGENPEPERNDLYEMACNAIKNFNSERSDDETEEKRPDEVRATENIGMSIDETEEKRPDEIRATENIEMSIDETEEKRPDEVKSMDIIEMSVNDASDNNLTKESQFNSTECQLDDSGHHLNVSNELNKLIDEITSENSNKGPENHETDEITSDVTDIEKMEDGTNENILHNVGSHAQNDDLSLEELTKTVVDDISNMPSVDEEIEFEINRAFGGGGFSVEKPNIISTLPEIPVQRSESVIRENFAGKTTPDLSKEIPANDRSEGDILDLVSDSGDDCNIVDSPEKLKALEEQLLAEDDDDEIPPATTTRLLGEDEEFGARIAQNGDAMSEDAIASNGENLVDNSKVVMDEALKEVGALKEVVEPSDNGAFE